jgi:transposase
VTDKVNVDDALKRLEELEARKQEIVQEVIKGLLQHREEIDDHLKRLGYSVKKTASSPEPSKPKRIRRTKEQIAADKLKEEQEKAERLRARLVKKANH